MFNTKSRFRFIVAAVAVIMVVLCMQCLAAAEISFGDVNIEYRMDKMKMLISGELLNGKINQRVSCIAVESESALGNIVSAGQGSVYTEDNVMKYVIECPFVISDISGYADIRLSANNSTVFKLMEKEVYMPNSDEINTALLAVAAAGKAGIEPVLTQYSTALGFPIDKYKSLSASLPKLKEAIANINVAITGDAYKDIISYSAAYNTALLAAEMTGTTSLSTIKRCLNDDLIEISTCTVPYPYYHAFDNAKKEAVHTYLGKCEMFSKEDVQTSFSDAVFSELLNADGAENGETYVRAFADLFDMDLKKFDSLTSKQRKIVIRECITEGFGNRESFIKYFNKMIDDIIEAETSSSTNSSSNHSKSSSSGSSSKSKTSGSILQSESVAAVQTTVKNSFADIGEAEWAKESINVLSEKGIVKGYADGSFKPNNEITRAEFVELIVRTFHFNAVIYSEKYNDVKSTDWNYKSIMTADALGIVNGSDGGMFLPDRAVTREEMSVIAYRALEKAEISVNYSEKRPQFRDEENISDYAQEAVGTLYMCGLISGMENDTFQPLENATRAQSAKIIYALMLKCEESK